MIRAPNRIARSVPAGWCAPILAALAVAATLALTFDAGLAPAQGMAPGRSMREHMREMMRGAVPPPGLVREALPESGSEGAALLDRYCTQCHDLPSPRYRTAAQWPPVLERMLGHMERMAGGGMGGMMGGAQIQVLPLESLNVLLAYLQAHAMQRARPEEMAPASPRERTMYGLVCSQCHAIPSPGLHPMTAWPGIVARMEVHMRHMRLPPLAPEARALILGALRATAPAGPGGEGSARPDGAN